MKQQDIRKKFHDGMHVRLANGVEIKGLSFTKNGCPVLDTLSKERPRNLMWRENGAWHYGEEDCPFNIVEVLSKPPKGYLKDMRVEDFKVGMFFKNGGQRQPGRVCGAVVRSLDNKYLVLHVLVHEDVASLHFINEDLLVSNVSRYGLYLDTEVHYEQ
jgi:hypothetical protein